MAGDVVATKKSIFDIRKDVQKDMDKLTTALSPFIEKRGFYPSVFYNENDINDAFRGIRQAIPDLDDYPGVFVHQDAPDTPIANYKGVEFRTSITKSIARENKQLLWTLQNLEHLKPLPPSQFDPDPSVQFCGTVVMMANGAIFPQQAPRAHSISNLTTCGLITQINMKLQQFDSGKFILRSGESLTDQGYIDLIARHPYGMSVRGWGNWDLRFYELLAYGRIPVHIHTDDELLFEREIPWDDHIVIVDDPSKIKSAVTEFHSQFSDDKSLAFHQKELVKLYHDYLSFPAFCKRFEKYYEDDLNRML